ncbi:MAG: 3'-5' exonuclease [Ignavibacteriae bacterium]|jgi:DNA polymerase-3 subunit epsilon|nr:3'-5' exonuclease [Ignavibacteriota bacterium]
MLNLNKPIVFFDIETTGLSIQDARIIQFGAAVYGPGNHIPTATMNLLINPGILIDPKATEVHGITNQMVMNQPAFANFAFSIRSFLTDVYLAGFNIRGFDIPILEREFHRVDMEFPDFIAILDVMSVVHKLNPRTLTASVKKYIPNYKFLSHDALSDATATADLFDAMSKVHKEFDDLNFLSDSNFADLAGLIIYNENKQPLFNFGKHKGELLSSQKDYCKWMINTNSFPNSTIKFIKSFLNT